MYSVYIQYKKTDNENAYYTQNNSKSIYATRSYYNVVKKCHYVFETTKLYIKHALPLLCLLLFAAVRKIFGSGILKSTNVQSYNFRHPNICNCRM